jgi:hypothetical protein
MAIRTLLRKRLLAITRTGTAMKPTRIGKRFIVIGRSAPATEKSACREPTNQRAIAQRLVVIKNGELVGSRSGR